MLWMRPSARRRNESSTAATASAGVSSRSTSASVRCSAIALRTLLRDDADLPAGLEHGPLDVLELRHLLSSRRDHQLVDRQPLALQIALDRLAVLDDDDRLAVERRARERELVAQERDRHLEDREGP